MSQTTEHLPIVCDHSRHIECGVGRGSHPQPSEGVSIASLKSVCRLYSLQKDMTCVVCCLKKGKANSTIHDWLRPVIDGFIE